jgi:small subunit ribosomal protein S1
MTENLNEEVEQVDAIEASIVQPEEEKVEASVVEDIDESTQDEEVIEEVTSKPKKHLKKKIEDPVAEADENFDWDSYTNDKGVSAKKREEFESLYDNTLSTIQEKECIDGTVISINKREVVVNIGYKSDGIVPMSEFRYNPELKLAIK